MSRFSLDRQVSINRLVNDFPSFTAASRARIAAISERLRMFLGGVSGDVPAPEEPEDFRVEGAANSVECRWSAVDNAVSYEVWHRPLPDGQDSLRSTVYGLTFLDTGLEAGDYLYWLVAKNVNGDESPASEEQLATVTEVTVPAPGTPAITQITTGPDNDYVRLNLSFTVNTASVRIERAEGNGNFVELASSALGVVYFDRTVLENTTYRYRVRAVGSDGQLSAYTPVVTAEVGARDQTAPPVPDNVTATAGDRQITLSWEAPPASDLNGYSWGIGTASGTYTQVRNVERDVTSVTVPGLSNGTQYFLSVLAYDTSGNESAYAAEVTATPVAETDTTPPAKPTGLTATGESDTSIRLTWNQNAETDISFYRLRRLSADGLIYQGIATTDAGTTTYLDAGLAPSSVERYVLEAVDTSGNTSERTDPVVGTTNADGDTDNGGTQPDEATGDTGGNSSAIGITAQYNEGSTVQQYVVNTAEQNGALFIPGMRAARTGRDAEYTRLSSALFTAMPNFQNLKLEKVGCGQWDANQKVSRPPAHNFLNVLSNLEVGKVGDAFAGVARKWNFRRYQVAGALTIDTDFVGRLRTDKSNEQVYPPGCYPESGVGPLWFASQKEHAVYDNPYGSCLMFNTTADHLGGHVFYAVSRIFDKRSSSPDNVEFQASPLVMLSNVHAYNTELDNSRGSGAVQIFDMGHPKGTTTTPDTHQGYVIIRNSTFVQAFPFQWNASGERQEVQPGSGTQWHQARGILDITQFQRVARPSGIQDGQTNPNPNDYDPETDLHSTKLALIQNCLFDVTNSDRPMITLDGIEEVIFENCMFIRRSGGNPQASGNIVVSLTCRNENRGTKPTGSVSFRNCRQLGGVRVQVYEPDGTEHRLDDLIDSENENRTVDAQGNTTTSFWDFRTDATDPAVIIDQLDPFASNDFRGYSFDWAADAHINGVTTAKSS